MTPVVIVHVELELPCHGNTATHTTEHSQQSNPHQLEALFGTAGIYGIYLPTGEHRGAGHLMDGEKGHRPGSGLRRKKGHQLQHFLDPLGNRHMRTRIPRMDRDRNHRHIESCEQRAIPAPLDDHFLEVISMLSRLQTAKHLRVCILRHRHCDKLVPFRVQ
jgi:hypothetical protein